MFKCQVCDAKKDVGIRKISGVSPDSDEFLALLNEVEKALMIRGGWFDTEQRFTFCVTGCHVVWPEFVGTILGVRFCGGDVVMQNNWYSFSGHGRSGFFGEGTGYNGGLGFHHNRSQVVMEQANNRPCYNDVSGVSGKQVRYYIVNPNDIGKKITIYGRKFGGQPLQESVNGTTQNGVTIVAANPFSATADFVTEIQSIVREPTQGMGYLYEYDPNDGSMRDIAAFRPGETNPRYRASRILNIPRNSGINGCCTTKVEALVKMQFVELTNDRDFIPVDNLRAVKLGIQAVRLEESGDDVAAVTKWTLAIKELNMEMQDKSPDDQIVFENATFGDTRIGQRRIY